jgi:hypothetical protein
MCWLARLEDMTKAGLGIFRCHAKQRLHGAVIHSAALANQIVVFVKNMNGPIHMRGFTLDCQPIVMEEGCYVKRRLEEFQVLIQSAKKILDLSGNLYRTSHKLRGHCPSAARRGGNISSEPICARTYPSVAE